MKSCPTLKTRASKKLHFDCPKCGILFTNHGTMGATIKHRQCCNDEERFWAKVNKTATCWLWTGFLNHDGYGRVGRKAGVRTGGRAHRISWEMANGPVPQGLYVMHKCDKPACVRPDHLRLGTHTDNMVDMTAKGRRALGKRLGDRVRLNPEKVRYIRKERATGRTYISIGEEMGITPSLARAACVTHWKHIQ